MEETNIISCRHKYLKQLKQYVNAEMEASQSFRWPLERFSTILETVLDHIHPEHMNHFINDLYTDGRYKWNLLLIAAKDGYCNITERLIKELNVNIEVEGVVEYENYIIRGASPLWCAAASGHFNIVKLLVSYGANVNHYTETHSTPLRAACFNGRLDIVKYLIEHGADQEIANVYDNTCLMISSYKGCLEVIDYLCKTGCDINRSDYEAVTALHAAAGENHLHIVQCLIKNGAIISKNSKGLTPLLEAALNLNVSVVDYFTDDTSNLFSQLECIEAFELLATSYTDYYVDNSNTEKLYEYLLKAMQLRYSDPNKPILKAVLPPSETYENHIECNTLEELKLIQHNADSLFMEAFVVRERILGPKHETLIPNLLYRGAAYADQKRFDRCFSLWLRALDVKKSNDELKIDDFERFAGIFDKMCHEDVDDFPFSVYVVVLRNIIQELISMKCKSKSFNLLTVLYLIVIIAKVMLLKTTNEQIEICNLIYYLNSFNFKTNNGSTLLHLCVNENTSVDTINF
ncbi:unnamed protein product, partial [Didymodactylos carnosus]